MSREIVKMKQGMSYSCKEKTIILNVFKYFRNFYPEKCVTEIVRCTSKATGCSEKSIFQFRKQEASPEGFKEPSKTKVRKNININSRFLKYDESVREGIKFIIYDLKYRNIVPSLSTILKNVNSNQTLPNFSLMTLRRLLFDMGFYYEKEKTTNKPILVEKMNKDSSDQKKKADQAVKVNISEKPKLTEVYSHNHIKSSNHVPLPSHVSETAQQNQIYISNQSHRHIPVHFGNHENHIIDGVPMGLQHTMMLAQKIPYPIHSLPHNMGFIQHPPSTHNMIMQQ